MSATAAMVRSRRDKPRFSMTWLQALPLTIILAVFLVVPIVVILIVSFWNDTGSGLPTPDFVFDNYVDLLTSWVTWSTYLQTIFYAVLVWALTLCIGFTVAYYLSFHVKTTLWQMVLFQVCAIPFLTSNIIRMISWIPLLGRDGIVNQVLLSAGLVQHPLEFLLYSNFSIIITFVHLFTLFMVVPIFNTMMRIDRALIEAARDAGASSLSVLRHIIIPLSMPGIAIGTIFVVTLVMGDFATVQMMGGGQRTSVGVMMRNDMSQLQYPEAAATAVVLLLIVLLMVAAILRVVDIRKEL